MSKKGIFEFENNLFRLDFKVLEKATLQVWKAANEGKGIFTGGIPVWRKKYLPQWNLHPDLEYDPVREDIRDKEGAALNLWTRCFCDRQAVSSLLNRLTQEAWADPHKKWIFYPSEVVKRTPEEVGLALRRDFRYAMNIVNPKRDEKGVVIKGKEGMSAGQGYWNNAQRLVKDFGGHPINLIKWLDPIAITRARIQQFDGIQGIANLYIMEMMDREVAMPSDPENAYFKIDIHKGRFAFNMDAIVPKEGREKVHFYSIIKPLEQAYWEICKRNRLSPKILDAALWIIGSVGCTEKNYDWCHKVQCPALEYCKANTPLDEKGGTFIYGNGTRANRNPAEGEQIHHKIYRDSEIFVPDMVGFLKTKRQEAKAYREARRSLKEREEKREAPDQQTFL